MKDLLDRPPGSASCGCSVPVRCEPFDVGMPADPGQFLGDDFGREHEIDMAGGHGGGGHASVFGRGSDPGPW